MLPNWQFSDVMTQVNNFLSNEVVTGLVLTMIALGVAPRIIDAVRRIVGWH